MSHASVDKGGCVSVAAAVVGAASVVAAVTALTVVGVALPVVVTCAPLVLCTVLVLLAVVAVVISLSAGEDFCSKTLSHAYGQRVPSVEPRPNGEMSQCHWIPW